MRHYKTVAVEEEQLTHIECDACGRKISTDDFIELQEMCHINFIGGYGSIFGDNVEVDLDICQYCLKNRFEDII